MLVLVRNVSMKISEKELNEKIKIFENKNIMVKINNPIDIKFEIDIVEF